MLDFLNQIFPLAIAASIPIMITAIGGLFSERSGVVNIGLEGLMLVGAFTSSITIHYFDQAGNNNEYVVWIAILLAGIVSGLFAILHAYASVSLKANQVISGTAINMLATALTIFFARFLTRSQNISLLNRADRYQKIPILSDIPLIGNWLFTDIYITSFFVLLLCGIAWFIIFKTTHGLRLRSCGEYPQAADSAGINVVKLRYQAVIISGILSGFGGAIYIVTIAGEFNGSVNGFGFLALGALIFGKWKPLNIVFATFFFGFMSTFASLSFVNEVISSFRIPYQFYNALPYVMTLFALVIFSRNASAPMALGEPYDAGKR